MNRTIAAAYAELVRQAVADVVRRQAACGLDIVADGEQGKVTFATYVKERLPASRGRGQSRPRSVVGARGSRVSGLLRGLLRQVQRLGQPAQTAGLPRAVSYIGQAAVQADIANLRAALESVSVTEAFIPATIPVDLGENQFYANADEYRAAVTDAMRVEYSAILDAGLLLQIDDPTLIEILNEIPRAISSCAGAKRRCTSSSSILRCAGYRRSAFDCTCATA